MQPTKNEESVTARIGSRVQPTKEQEEYASGFTAALNQLYAQLGAPAVVRDRSRSTPSDLGPPASSHSAPSLSAARSGRSSSSTAGSSVACSAASTSVSSRRSLPAAVTDMMAAADSESQAAATTIPLCVFRVATNESDNQPNDESQHQQPTNDRNSTGIKHCLFTIRCVLSIGFVSVHSFNGVTSHWQSRPPWLRQPEGGASGRLDPNHKLLGRLID